MDLFWSSIQRSIKKAFPHLAGIQVAYGSAITTMKPTGPGEAAVPTGAMFTSCKRAFKHHVRVVSEFRSTMMQWETGTKKELAYKSRPAAGGATSHEHKEATEGGRSGRGGRASIQHAQNGPRQAQEGRQCGALGASSGAGEEEGPAVRCAHPEVRGLRFSPEDSKYYFRDNQAALMIARLWCMEVLHREKNGSLSCLQGSALGTTWSVVSGRTFQEHKC